MLQQRFGGAAAAVVDGYVDLSNAVEISDDENRLTLMRLYVALTTTIVSCRRLVVVVVGQLLRQLHCCLYAVLLNRCYNDDDYESDHNENDDYMLMY